MAVRTWVGRFCVADGRVDEEGPWLGSLIRQRPDEEADELYTLVEPASAQSEEYTSQLVDVISQLYAKDPLSLTGALTRSLRSGHEHLREWNRRSLPEHQVGAGATCLALRGTDAYLAQVGPSVAYVRSAAGDVRRIEPVAHDFAHALGVGDDFEPQLTRVNISPGDLILVASSQLESVVPVEHIERILSIGEDALPEFYRLCRDRPNFALVLLSCFEEHVETPPDFLTRDGAAAEAAAVLATSSSDDGRLGAPQGVLVDAPVGIGPSAGTASLGATMDGFVLPPRTHREQVQEITASTAPSRSAGVRLRGGDATPRYKRTTGAFQMPQFRIPKLAIFAAVALLLVAGLAYWQIPGSVKESREAKFATLVAGARESNARAQATNDAGLKRQLLGEARTKLADASKIHKDDADVGSLQADVTSALGVLNAVFEIKDFAPVTDLAQQVTGSLSVTRAVVGGDHAYFLEAKGKRVLRVPLAGGAAPETILTEGDLAGFMTASRPMQITWSEQTQSLIVIDDKRQAFAYFPGKGTLPLTVRAPDGIGTFDGVAGSGGNLYILDVKENQVWRYLPGQGGFDSERAALLDAADLHNATEVAVGQDVYVLDAKLGIRRFVGKTEAAFPLAGIDTPLVSPASMSVLPGSNRIVVADRGNKRVVLATADGTFLRQFVSPSFTDLRAVSVDEGARIIYVLNGDTLLKAPFPP